jgi:hypothetical protein
VLERCHVRSVGMDGSSSIFEFLMGREEGCPTRAWSRLPTASAALPLPAAAQAQRSASMMPCLTTPEKGGKHGIWL